MDYKSYNKKLLFSIIITFLTLITLNYLVNPFQIFNHGLKFKRYPELKKQERLTKTIYLEQPGKYDVLFIGTSRPDHSLDAQYYTELSGKKAINMCIEGAGFYEQKFIIKRALKYHPEIKTVLLGVDFDSYYNIPDEEKLDLSQYNKNILNKYTTALLSYDATGASIITIIKSLTPNCQKGFNANGIKTLFHNDKINISFDTTINQYKASGIDFPSNPDLSQLSQFIKELNSKGVEVIIFMPPVHATMFEILKQNGAWDRIRDFKLELAKIQPFYDFYYPSEYSIETINPDMQYFFESSHCTYIVGNKIIEKIILNRGDFGEYAQTNNINTNHKKHTKMLESWEKENLPLVKKKKKVRKEGL